MARVVETDNFPTDLTSENFVGEVMPWDEAKKLAAAKNMEHGVHALRFWKVVENDYRLQTGDPNE